ncbi:aldo/keto reductase [Lysinibacillus fusiformis]|uniref:aldo/keto reductase n=1 Tax=Lysinibacillus fusiformis TaxID=28031 RepID=UPI0011A616B2|nr:aldo/keto reductase [Lysinibacillus fusiformis]
MNLQSSKTLSNGVEMPRFGLGVYKMTDHEETLQSIDTALKVGYRAIDTASLYGNEAEVGEVIRHSGVPREQIFVTTKVWNNDQGYDETLRAFEISLKKLNMDYVDLYLTHWAVPETFEETYRAIERLYDEKLIRATGVSNHHEHHLEKILAKANIAPMVNQVEMHPYLQQQALSKFCHEHQIAVTAWSPLGRGGVLDDSTIVEIGKEIDKTAAQVVLRWHLQNDTLIIPKSVTPSRIEENAQIFDFELTQTQMDKITSLNRNQRFGQDPDHFKFDF